MEKLVKKDLYNFEHRWKLRDWMEGKVDFDRLGFNKRGHYLIECNPEISEWRYLSQHQESLYLLEKNPDKISWHIFITYDWAYFITKRKIDKFNNQDFSIQSEYTLSEVEKWKYHSKVFKTYVYGFPTAIKYIEEKVKNNIEEVKWDYLSWNREAIHILREHKDKIVWSYLAMNSNPEAMDIIKEEIENIIKKTCDRNSDEKDDKYNMFWYCLIGNKSNPRVKEVILENIDRIKDSSIRRISEREEIEFIPYFEKKIKEYIEKMDRGEDLEDFYLNLEKLSKNPVAVDLLLKYENIIDWKNFSANPSPKAIEYLKEHQDMIELNALLENRSNEAMELIEEKLLNNDIPNMISIYRTLSYNPYIFELDYKFLDDRMNIIKIELMEKTWHPKRFMQWCL